MSLYREPGRAGRARIAAAAAVLVVVAAAFYGIGRATAPERSLEDAVAGVSGEAGRAADAVELVSIHYGAAASTQQEAAREQLERAQDAFAEVSPELRLLDPDGERAAADALDRLSGLVEQGAPAAQVEDAADAARRAIEQAAPAVPRG